MGAYDDTTPRLREMTGLIAGDRAFVSCQRDSEIAALAYGVIRNGCLWCGIC